MFVSTQRSLDEREFINSDGPTSAVAFLYWIAGSAARVDGAVVLAIP